VLEASTRRRSALGFVLSGKQLLRAILAEVTGDLDGAFQRATNQIIAWIVLT